jgi:unsaturated rhamnogalacturonyl hydrolase
MKKQMYKKSAIIILFILPLSLLLSLDCQTEHSINQKVRIETEERADLVANHFFDKHDNFSSKEKVWGNYTLDLTFEAFLAIDQVTGNKTYLPRILKVMDKRYDKPSNTKSSPFCCITFALYEATNNKEYLVPFLSKTKNLYANVGRSPEGAIGHKPKEPGRHLLIDYLQDYASRMAKAGYISGDVKYFEDCVGQYRIYRKLLRNPETGLWSQGRGWLDDPMKLSQGAWSRGHGWLIRGMVTSLKYLPEDSKYYKEMQVMLWELADDLLVVQDERGMWHQLLHLPFEDSYEESSGTAMIAYYFALSIHEGYLEDDKYRKAAIKSFSALKNSVTKDGVVLHTCKGPGPIYSIDNYYRTPAQPDDPHGAPAILFALAGQILLAQ